MDHAFLDFREGTGVGSLVQHLGIESLLVLLPCIGLVGDAGRS
jgi:hypothetical protein